MAESGSSYRIQGVSVFEINQILSLIATRLDRIEGFRGRPVFRAAGTFEDDLTVEGDLITPRIKITAEGGLAVLLENRTGADTVKGYLVRPDDDENRAAALVPVGSPAPIGVLYESGVKQGEDAWVVVLGVADVYFGAAATRGHHARMCKSGDTGAAAGVATSVAVMSSPFSTDDHWREVGHVLQTTTRAGLAKVALHFN